MTNINSGPAKVKPTTLDLALDYLKRYPTHKLFPIARGQKFPPVFAGYQKVATRDPIQLEKWAKRYRGCSWGIEPASSGIIVLDADLKAGKNGQASLDDLEMMYGPLPSTSTVRTPSGGLHYRFKATSLVQHKFRINGYGEHLDSPHYTVMPGCVMADGSKYEYENDLPLADAPEWFAELPAWMKPARVEDSKQDFASEPDTDDKIKMAIDYLTDDAPPAIENQNGDATALQVCGMLKDFGISETMAIDLIRDYYNERCEPPWEDGGEAKVHNAYAYLHENAPGSASTAEADFTADPLPPPPDPHERESAIRKIKALRKKTKVNGCTEDEAKSASAKANSVRTT